MEIHRNNLSLSLKYSIDLMVIFGSGKKSNTRVLKGLAFLPDRPGEGRLQVELGFPVPPCL